MNNKRIFSVFMFSKQHYFALNALFVTVFALVVCFWVFLFLDASKLPLAFGAASVWLHNVTYVFFFIPHQLAKQFISNAFLYSLILLIATFIFYHIIISLLFLLLKKETGRLDISQRRLVLFSFIIVLAALGWSAASIHATPHQPDGAGNNYCIPSSGDRLCSCPGGYVREEIPESLWHKSGTGYTCEPLICRHLFGLTVHEDVIYENKKQCEKAIKLNKVSLCNDISYSYGRDVCAVGCVSLTRNRTVCNSITNWYLKNECHD